MNKISKISGQPVICQLFSFIPDHLLKAAISKHRSDYYYKTLHTKKQLVFLLYGIITRCPSLSTLCKNLLFLENKLGYLGIDSLPAVSTLSDANINRKSDVFAELYFLLYQYYKDFLSDSQIATFLRGEVDLGQVKIFDATTISLWVDLFKGAGRNPIDGRKKGGLKIQACLPLSGFVPEIVHLGQACSNDRNFLGQLPLQKGTIYVFDKGYSNYMAYENWTRHGVFFVTRLMDNAKYQVLTTHYNDVIDFAGGGVIKDETIHLQSNSMERPLKARIITYKDPLTGKTLRFLSNMFDYHATTIATLYKNRWSIEVLFKQLKQNFELSYFYSDSSEGIKSQIWIALIANLLFSVIHKQIKQAEQFVTMVSMACNNMGSYICFISLLKSSRLNAQDRDLKRVQLELFNTKSEGVFDLKEKSP